MAEETDQERNKRLRAELGTLARRISEIQTELEVDGDGGPSPEERRRRFRVINGEASGGVGGWLHARGKHLIRSLAGAGGGAASPQSF